MDSMTSVEFRKRYASLKKPVQVTVLGRPIGVWFPGVLEYGEEDVAASLGQEAVRAGVPYVSITEPSFNTRPFTPVPKKGR